MKCFNSFHSENLNKSYGFTYCKAEKKIISERLLSPELYKNRKNPTAKRLKGSPSASPLYQPTVIFLLFSKKSEPEGRYHQRSVHLCSNIQPRQQQQQKRVHLSLWPLDSRREHTLFLMAATKERKRDIMRTWQRQQLIGTCRHPTFGHPGSN